ncbi:MAG TPA: ectonucleotide pyrophosphatase/phosphodiesterase [Blastocatellia bacterium]|nr:ectonucleotide pyrophosphatase/phosphodiesterase [Blastocatellia bacterium]
MRRYIRLIAQCSPVRLIGITGAHPYSRGGEDRHFLLNRRHLRWRFGSVVLLILFFLAGQFLPPVGVASATIPPQQPAGAARERFVVMISVDGLVPDYYLNPDRYGLKVPTLRRLRESGAYADGVIGVYPSVTYPSHTAMVTGARPRDHGIYSNRIFEDPTEPPTGRWYWWANAIQTDTLWKAARRAGLKTAAISWPVTVGAEIDYNIPEITDPGTDFHALNPAVRREATPGLIDEILRTLPQPLSSYSQDDLRIEAATFILTRYKPNLMLLHLVELDGVHHRFGPHSKEAYEEAEKQDGRIKRILDAVNRAGIEDRTTIVLVSDHGFMPIEREFHPGVLMVRGGLVTLNAEGRVTAWKAAVWSHGGSAAILLRDNRDEATVQALRKIFAEYVGQPSSPLKQIVERAELEALGADPRAIFFLEPADYWYIGGEYRGEVIRPARNRGAHGQLPSRPVVRASLILAGAGIRRGARVPVVNMTDIAPTVAAVLGIKLAVPPYSQPLTALLESSSSSTGRSASRSHR